MSAPDRVSADTGASGATTNRPSIRLGVHFFKPSVFCNPPYGKAREPWVEKCIEAGERGQKVILLIPAATDTRIFQRAAETATAIVFVRGRVKFGTLRPNRRQCAALGFYTSGSAATEKGVS